MRAIACAAALMLCAACQPPWATSRSALEAGEDDVTVPAFALAATVALPSWDRAGSCGVARWAVKTGTDSAAGQVNLIPVPETVASLGAIPKPQQLGPTRLPQEMRTVQVTAQLVKVQREGDSDYHLYLTAGGALMISEVPHPSCVASGPFRVGAAQVRAAVDALVPALANTRAVVPVGRTVTLTGVVFFDKVYPQPGAAPNGVEQHPLVALSAQ